MWKATEVGDADADRHQICRGRGHNQSRVLPQHLGMQQFDPCDGREQNQGVGDEVEARTLERRLPEAARHETIQKIGDRCCNQACPNNPSLAEERKYPDNRDEENPQPGDGIGNPAALLVHERSLPCGDYL